MAIDEEPAGAERGTCAANRVPLFSLLAAGLISSVGNVITTLAVTWFVLMTTGSTARVGHTARRWG